MTPNMHHISPQGSHLTPNRLIRIPKEMYYVQFGMLQIYKYNIHMYKRILMVWTLREYHNFSSVKHQFVTIQSKCVSPFKWLYYGKHNRGKKRLTTVQNTLFPMIPGTYKGNRGKHSSVYE